MTLGARLLYRDGYGRDGQLELDSARLPIYVGRALECAIRTEDAMVSRKHTMIQLENGRYVVEDLGSSNGTQVQGRPVTKQVLSHNDVVQCGSLWLRYVEDRPVTQGTPSSTPPPPAAPVYPRGVEQPLRPVTHEPAPQPPPVRDQPASRIVAGVLGGTRPPAKAAPAFEQRAPSGKARAGPRRGGTARLRPKQPESRPAAKPASQRFSLPEEESLPPAPREQPPSQLVSGVLGGDEVTAVQGRSGSVSETELTIPGEVEVTDEISVVLHDGEVTAERGASGEGTGAAAAGASAAAAPERKQLPGQRSAEEDELTAPSDTAPPVVVIRPSAAVASRKKETARQETKEAPRGDEVAAGRERVGAEEHRQEIEPHGQPGAQTRSDAAAQELQERLDKLQQDYDREVADGKRVRLELVTLRERWEDQRRTGADRDEQLSAHDRVVDELRKELASSRDEMASARAKLMEKAEEIKARDRQLKRAADDIAKLSEEIRDLERQRADMPDDPDQGRRRLDEQLGEIEHLRAVIEEQEQMLEERRLGLANQEEIISGLRADNEDVKEKLVRTAAERDKLRRRKASLEERLGLVEQEKSRAEELVRQSPGAAAEDGTAAARGPERAVLAEKAERIYAAISDTLSEVRDNLVAVQAEFAELEKGDSSDSARRIRETIEQAVGSAERAKDVLAAVDELREPLAPQKSPQKTP